ncbi:MAG: rhamnogalacturonan acetylesterase [Kiritimatiellae bacterium]|nr:rhamnogalacturonan acetylesterase [Kiritimatiellia bacterium]
MKKLFLILVVLSSSLCAKGVASNAYKAWQRFHYEAECQEGNHLVKVLLGSDESDTKYWIKAESRRLMSQKIELARGEKLEYTFTVNTRTPKLPNGSSVKLSGAESSGHERWDSRLTIDIFWRGAAPTGLQVEPAHADTVTIFLAGDSTVCCYNTEPYATWGQMLSAFFTDKVAIANHAECGRALSSFKSELREDKVLSLAKPGDWLFIQFGHNDQKEKCEFEERMRRYEERLNALIDAFEAKGGRVALVSPMERRRFDKDGKPFKTLQEYEDTMAKVAKERNLPFINLHDLSFKFYSTLGEEKSKSLFGFRKELDNTHHSVHGGWELALAVANEIKKEIPSLARYLREDLPSWSPDSPSGNPNIPRSGKMATAKPEEK